MTSTTVNNGQTVSNLDITNGNSLDVSAGGTANNTTIESGGFVAVEATGGGLLGGIFGPKTGGVADGVTVNGGGILDLRDSNSNASNIVLNGGALLEIDATASVTGSLTFGATTGTQNTAIQLNGDDTNFKATITGFSASSAIEENDLPFAGATFKTTVSNGNTIATVSGTNGVTNIFTFAGTPQLMMVADDGDGTPQAVIATTNTTNPIALEMVQGTQPVPGSTASTQQASASAPGDTVSALQTGHASQPATSFLAHPQAAAPAGTSPLGLGMGAATHAQAATAATAGVQSLSSIAHEMTMPQSQGLATSMLGALSQPQIHRVDSALAGFPSNPTAVIGGSAGALLGVPQHAVTAGLTHTLLHIG